MITATKNSNTIISAAHHHQYPGHPSMHGRTLSMVSSNGGDDIFASFADGDEDGLSFDDLDAEGRDGLGPLDDSLGASHGAGGAGGANGAARKGKKLASTAEKKATHNAVERARRESLNTRFLVLADMLPGMNHVKRASKAAIVNKSIALIQDLQASEQKLTSENEALKAELAVLRQRVAAGPTPATPAAGAVPTPSAPFPGMHAFAMHGMPMIPGMPPMMHHHPAAMPVPSHPPSAPISHEEAYRRASMEAAAAAAAAAAASAPPNMQMFQAGMQSYFGMPNFPLVDSPPSTSALVPAVKAESTGAGSPNSIYSQAAAASHAVQNVNAQHANLASELFPHGLFDFGMTGGSPAPSWTNGNSPPSGIGMHYTTAAAAASAELNKPGSSSAASSGGGPPGLSLGQSSAASPAGSQSSASTSITTPANTFSPIPLPSQQLQQHNHQQHFDACSGSSASGTPPPPSLSSVNANAIAAMAAFSENADPALLAAQFNPSELAKAQSELGAFIAYQQRMAGFAAAAAAAAATQQQQQAASYQNTAPQPTPSPTQSSFNLPTAQQQQQQAMQQGNANATANANAAALAAQAAAMGTMPAAWQMMLAQHHQQAQLAHQHQQQQQQHNSQAAAAAAMAAAAAAGFQGQF